MAQLEMTVFVFIFGALFGWALMELLLWWLRRRRGPKNVLIILGVTKMATVGKSFLFTVVAKNAGGVVVPDTIVSVTTDNGTVTFNPDGTGGVLVPATAGTANLTATDGTLNASLAVTVADDMTPATLTIVPS